MPLQMRHATKSNRKQIRQRKGIASLECALALPIVVLITFGTIDLCSAMFLRESITIAAYEGARVGVGSAGTDAQCMARVNQILDQRGIAHSNATSISSPSFETAQTLDHVTVTVSVPCAGNLPLSGWMFAGRSLGASVTMRKEFANNDEDDD